MNWLTDILSGPPCPGPQKAEVNKLIAELLTIGREDDFLSERPGGQFNGQSRHIRARAIGLRLSEIGGLELMEYVHRQVKRKMRGRYGEHLEYAWDGVGPWRA